MKRTLIAFVGLVFAAWASLVAYPAVSQASPTCASGGAGGYGGGGQCDFDFAPDGSHEHCDTVYVLGFGGTNCYWVNNAPPPPQP